MPDPAPSKPSAPRIAETAAGKALMALLALFYALLATAAAGGEWHTLFLPACLLAAALLLFCFCILRGYKIPSPGLPGWLALGLGGGYFLLRAWFSPWFYYEGVADLGLIVTAMAMFMAGAYAGAGNGERSVLPVLAAALGLLNALLWGYQNMTGTEASWFRPDYSLFGTELRNIGLFGYKNFSAHFLSGIFPLRVQHGFRQEMGHQPVHGAGARSRFLHLQFPRRLSECAGWRHPVLFHLYLQRFPQ